MVVVDGTRERKGLRFAVALLFTITVGISLFSYHAYQVTSIEMVERLGVAAADEVFNVRPLLELYRPELLRQAERAPNANVTIPGLNMELDVKAAALRDLPEDQFADFIVRSVIRHLYNNGFSEAYLPAGFDAAQQAEILRFVEFVSTFLSSTFNKQVGLALYLSLALSLVLAIPLLLLSRGYLKLTGFGGSLIVAGLPGILLAATQARIDSLLLESGASRFLADVLVPFIGDVQHNYLAVLLLGVGLFLAGSSGMFFTKRKVPATPE